MAGAVLERVRSATQIKPDRIYTERYDPVIRRAAIDSGIPETEVMVWEGDKGTLTTQYLLELQEATRNHEIGKLKVTFVPEKDANNVYTSTEKIIQVAKAGGHTKVDLGWGYISEKHEKIRILEGAGIFSTGPTANEVKTWGNKTNSLINAEKAGLDVLRWVRGSELTDWEKAKLESERIGYPQLIKADEGGGGNGTTEVTTPEQFEAEWKKGTISKLNQEGGCHIIEKAKGVRHIEFQFLADKYGTVAVIGQRDCILIL